MQIQIQIDASINSSQEQLGNDVVIVVIATLNWGRQLSGTLLRISNRQ